ncbi:TIM barrel protein [Parasphingorhabdus sp.]|uniref:sugar phosphate isomerase/epimerase family protein n=1 Tax=Parasphingorhabdus sp. TaxID=2709688 RepID=UPI003263341F
MRKLALHQITMLDGGPEGLVRFAADAGLNGICLFTATPRDANGQNMFPVVDPASAPAFKRVLQDHDIGVINAEYFPVMPQQDVSVYLPAIHLAAALGAKRLVTHIHETNRQRAMDQLSKLCAMALEHGLEVGLEFTGFSGGCSSLADAVTLHHQLNQPNLTIAVDTLHLFRTGGTLEQLKTVDPAIIGYAQLCDGPNFQLSNDYLDEAMSRMLPGEGVFPLKELVALLAPHVDIDVEVPNAALVEKSDRQEWAQRAVVASRNLLTDGK